MIIRTRLLVLAAALVAVTAPLASRGNIAPQSDDGRLLVIVVVDQMRADYLTRFKGFWKEGFARILADGAIFERGAYPYLNTVTCAGHATIGSGAFPATHGVIMNEWWQRETRSRMSCTNDPSVKPVPYSGTPERVGHSAYRLRIPSMGDRLRAWSPQSRIVTLSMKPRSTVMLAGHGGTAVTWFSDANTWGTSTAYTPAPIPQVQSWVDANPVDKLRGEIWNRVYDPSRYSGTDDGVGERPPSGWTPLFAHPLVGAPGTAPRQFYELWERSPYSDAMVGALAAHLVQSLQLGRRGVVDYLGVSFSAVDYVGHNFGPNSHELQDTLIRLDHTLGQLLAVLDTAVGRDRYTLALSADHGVSFIPEALAAAGESAGRVVNAQVTKVAEAAMTAAHGPGPHIASVEYTEIYLTEKTRALVDQNPTALKPLIDAVAAIEGVLRVWPSKGLENKRNSSDALERAAALSYYPGESGDVQLVLKPNWISTDTSAATHGTFHPYDQQVPVVFFGSHVKRGRYQDAATPADIAPTLAHLVKLNLPGVDGKVLKSALK